MGGNLISFFSFSSFKQLKWTSKKHLLKYLKPAHRNVLFLAILTTAGCLLRWHSTSSPTLLCQLLVSSKDGGEEPCQMEGTPLEGPFLRMILTRVTGVLGLSSTIPVKDFVPQKSLSKLFPLQTSFLPRRDQSRGATPLWSTSTSYKTKAYLDKLSYLGLQSVSVHSHILTQF